MSILATFLHNFLLLLLLSVRVDVVVHGLGVQSQRNTHDGQQGEQIQPARTVGFLMCKHHVYAVFKGTVSDAVCHGVPARGNGFLDKQILILTHIDALREYRRIGFILMDGAQVLAQHPHSRIKPLQGGEYVNEEYICRVMLADVASFMGEHRGVLRLVVAT